MDNPQPPQGSSPAPDASPARRPAWQKLVGVKRRDGKWLRFGLTRWGWLLMVMIVFGVGSLGFAEYSMQPDFCRSCHIMEPYYQAWHSSTHRNVPCADCHFEPGLKNTLKGKWQASSQAVKYVTNTYGSKPHAEVRDESCMRSGCHEQRLLEGKVTWDAPSERGGTVQIRFDHAPHLNQERRGKQLRCVSCHSQMVQGQHIVVTTDTCFLCHMKGVEHGRHEKTLGGCESCHEAPKDQIRLATGLFAHGDYVDRGVTCENCHSDVVKGDGAVARQVCWTCHNQPAQISRFNDTELLHDKHVTEHKVECSSCHTKIQHNLVAAEPSRVMTAHGALGDSGSCAQCHEKTHGGPAEMYRGTGARGVSDMPSPMSRAQVDCIACHRAPKTPSSAAMVVGQTFAFSPDTCTYCHGTKYDGELDLWRQRLAVELEKTEILYAEATEALAAATNLPPGERLKAERLLDDADYNIRFVRLAHGEHNVNYAAAVLSAAVESSRSALQIARGTVAVSSGEELP